MADNPLSANELAKMSLGLDTIGINLGVVERATLKWTKAFQNLPVVKQAIQFRRFGEGLKQATDKIKGNNEGLADSVKKHGDLSTTMTTMVAGLMNFNTVLQKAGGLSNLLKASLSAMGPIMLFMFGIIGILVIGVLALIAVFADLNSPLVQMMDDWLIVGEVLNGLRIIIVGEDGESGVKGAIDVLITALILGAFAWMVFGLPVAILVATIVAAIGIFKWAKGKTDSWMAGLIAAGAVVMVGLSVFATFVSTLGGILSAAVMLPIALILAGITGMWLSLTGELSYWWGVISAIGTAIGAVLLAAVLFTGVVVSLPLILIAAAAAAIIFTIIFHRDKILAIGASILEALVGAWNWLDDFFNGIREGIVNGIVSIGTSISNAWSNFWSAVGDGWDRLWGYVGKKIDSVFTRGRNFLASVRAGFSAARTAITGFINNIINDAFINPINAALSVINSLKIDIPKWARIGPLSGVSSLNMGIPLLTPLAEGGIVTGPTPALIGERGPEAVIPLDKAGGVGNTFNINIDVSGIVATSDQAKREFADEISRAIMRDVSDKIGMPTYGRF